MTELSSQNSYNTSSPPCPQRLSQRSRTSSRVATMPLPVREMRFVPRSTGAPHAVEMRGPPPNHGLPEGYTHLMIDHPSHHNPRPSPGWNYLSGVQPKTGHFYGAVPRHHRVSNRERCVRLHFALSISSRLSITLSSTGFRRRRHFLSCHPPAKHLDSITQDRR